MNLADLLRLAVDRLGSSRSRSALTMLGVVIGVASVVALTSVGQGSTRNITSQLENLGTNLLTVSPGRVRTGFTFGAVGSSTTLTLDDAAAIAKLSEVAAVAPQVTSQKLVTAGSRNTTTSIIGTTPSYLDVHNYQVWQGAFLNQIALDQGLRVAVLGATTADDLGLTSSSIGGLVSIGGLPFRVVGILQPKGGVANVDDQILVPLATVRHEFVAGDSAGSIGVTVSTASDTARAESEIELLLRQQHRLASSAADDFSITTQAQLLSTVGSISTTLTLLLTGIASISLVVGGIGIMNIMLVSVRERTREIGIRKAIGARRQDVLAQFLVEALTLSLLGGLIGIGVGLLASWAIGAFAGWGFVLDVPTLLIAAGVSAAVGVVFGVWPARQAARLDPIVALRYE